MKLLYYISIRLYALAIRFVSLWNPKAKQWIEGRKNWQTRLNSAFANKKNIHWFHCASLGEFEQARPLIEKIKKEVSSASILVTFFSPSGYRSQKNYELADYVCYLPLDTNSNARKFISELDLAKVYFVKYEVWPCFFQALKNNNIPFYLISATFRESQIYFKPTGKWFKNILSLATSIFVQDEASKAVLDSHNVEGFVAGDTRYDRVFATAQKAIKNPVVDEFCRSKFTLLAGSCWEKEEEIISEAFYGLSHSFKVVFAPHDISEKHIKGIVNLFQNDTEIIRYSEVKEGVNLRDYDVLILDNIGLLSNAYQYGSAAFVGGGFTNALHNILEPATFGLPVFFGNNHQKFPEANDMKLNGAGIVVDELVDFQNQLNAMIENSVELVNQQSKNKEFVESRIGATELIFSHTIRS